MEIQTVEENDLEVILQLQKDCYQTEAALHQEFNIPPLTQDLASISEEFYRGTRMLKALLGGDIVGSVRAYESERTCFIGRLIVRADHQNKKIGQRLMAAIEDEFSQCIRYELFTGHRSEKNLYLYKKLGYTEIKRQELNERLTLVFLEKRNQEIKSAFVD